MKTKYYVLIFLMLCSFFELKAQSLETVRKSRKIKDEITLIVKGVNKLDYLIDSKKKEKTLDTIDYFKVTDEEFRVYAKFQNPLKYRINATNKELDDELYKASQDYITTAISFLSQLKSNTKSNNVKMEAMISYENIVGEISFSLQLEPKLAEMYLLINGTDAAFLNNNVSFFQTLDTLNFAEAKKEILENYNQLFSSLEGIKKIASIEDIVASNKKVFKKNIAIINKLKELYKEVEKETSKVTSIKTVLSGYVIHVIKELGEDIKAFEKEMTALKSKYDKIEKLFLDIKKKENSTDTNSYLVKSFPNLKKSKRYELTVTVEEIKFNSDDKTISIESSQKYVLHVRRFRLFTPVVSSGVLYTDLNFKQFGTDEDANGNTIITESKDKVSNLSIAAYLNMYVENKWNLPVYVQLGFGTSTERPLLFLGGGFTLTDRLNISAGGIFTWFPQLNDLAVGQQVSGTSAIQDDITYRFDTKPKFYIGINFDLGNKK